MDNRRGTILALIGGLAGVLVVLWLQFFVFAKVGEAMAMWKNASSTSSMLSAVSSDESTIKMIAHSANAVCPKQISETVRMDSINYPADHCMGYYYTISNMSANPQDSAQLMAAEPNMLQSLKAEPESQSLAKVKAILLYIFRDKQGHVIATIRITPDMYSTEI